MSAITQEQLIAILKIFGQSKLISELLEQTSLNNDSNYLVINQGQDDAKKIKIPLIRGYKGNYNATTNTPSLSNGTGVSGDVYTVLVAGSRDFGNGFINLVVDDIIYYNGSKYVKITQNQISDIIGLQDALNAKNFITSDESLTLAQRKDDILYGILDRYTTEALKVNDYSLVNAVGIDETSRRKGHNYITLFVDLQERKTIFITEGKDNKTVESFVTDLEEHNGKAENIKE